MINIDDNQLVKNLIPVVETINTELVGKLYSENTASAYSSSHIFFDKLAKENFFAWNSALKEKKSPNNYKSLF
ncbi:MAG: hypothetical protein AAB693_00850 [Patescibacteria group bacterium]